MPGQHVLHPAEVDVAVDLRDVVGRAGHVVLDEVATLEHRDLGGLRVDVDAHEVATDRPALALAAAAGLEDVVVEVDAAGGEHGLDRRAPCDPCRRPARPGLALAPLARRRRRHRRDRGRRGGAGAWPGRRPCRRPAPPGARPGGAAGAGIESPIWGLRARLGGRAADQRGVGGLDGLRPALPWGVGQLRVAVVVRRRRRRRRRRRHAGLRTGTAAVAAAAGAAAASLGGAACRRRRRRRCGRLARRVRRRRSRPGGARASASAVGGDGGSAAGAGGVAGGDLGHGCVPFSSRTRFRVRGRRRAACAEVPEGDRLAAGAVDRRPLVRSEDRARGPGGIEGSEQLRGAEAAGLGGQLGDEHGAVRRRGRGWPDGRRGRSRCPCARRRSAGRRPPGLAATACVDADRRRRRRPRSPTTSW